LSLHLPADPVARARLALAAWWIGWPLIHVGNVMLPQWFFQHVLIALSVYAIIATLRDNLRTAQVHAEQE
jgi:hypothetical protein